MNKQEIQSVVSVFLLCIIIILRPFLKFILEMIILLVLPIHLIIYLFNKKKFYDTFPYSYLIKIGLCDKG